jgi:hypothetical protein
MNKKIMVFFHIEKCGGTSLVEYFRNNIPLQACEAISKTNALTLSELEKTLSIYPKLRVISGHNLQVDIIDWLEERGYSVESFTILRDPIERAISDYLHDFRKGTIQVPLIDYIDIPWKQNYLAKFLGSGSTDYSYQNLEKIDNVVSVERSAGFVTALLAKHKIPQRSPYLIANKATGELPDDVKLMSGVRIGKYNISAEAYKKLIEVNRFDVELWRYAQTSLHIEQGEEQHSESKGTSLGATVLKKAASVQRNLLYKPRMGRWPVYYSLPRNSIDPRYVDEENAFR